MLPMLVLAASIAAPPVVSPDWLQSHLNDPNVHVISVAATMEATDADYQRGHIPGAHSLDHMATFSGNGLASPAELARVFAAAGVTDGSRVVLYGAAPMVTAWVYSALASIGFADDVSWLDGGIAAWRASKRPIETTSPPPGHGTLTVRPAPADYFVNAAWVRDRLQSSTTKLLDVRTQKEWQAGHLPNATLILWQDLFADPERQTFKSPEQIRALLTRAGVGPDQDVVTYCQMGMRASLMGFAAKLAGVKSRVYLGSWNDWSKDSANPVIHPSQ